MCIKFGSANVLKLLISMRRVVGAGNVVVLDAKNPHVRHTGDGTVIKLCVNNGVCTTDMSVCLDETGLVFSWQGQWVARVSQRKWLGAREVRRLEQQNRWVPWRIVDCKWTVDRLATPIESRQPPRSSSAGGENHERTDFKAFGTTAGYAIRSVKRTPPHSDPCRARIEECLKTTPEGYLRHSEERY